MIVRRMAKTKIKSKAKIVKIKIIKINKPMQNRPTIKTIKNSIDHNCI
jgi:hypothetical protein